MENFKINERTIIFELGEYTFQTSSKQSSYTLIDGSKKSTGIGEDIYLNINAGALYILPENVNKLDYRNYKYMILLTNPENKKTQPKSPNHAKIGILYSLLMSADIRRISESSTPYQLGYKGWTKEAIEEFMSVMASANHYNLI